MDGYGTCEMSYVNLHYFIFLYLVLSTTAQSLEAGLLASALVGVELREHFWTIKVKCHQTSDSSEV
jgi:hypothetical protein